MSNVIDLRNAPAPDLSSMKLYQKAIPFATEKHANAIRKDGEPYVNHVLRVATKSVAILRTVETKHIATKTDLVAAAGALHDTIEDCGVTYDDIATRFGDNVAKIVSAVSNDKRLPKDERITEYCDRLWHADIYAQVVKVADIIDNAQSCYDLLKVDRSRRSFANNWIGKARRMLGSLNTIMVMWVYDYCAQEIDKLSELVHEIGNAPIPDSESNQPWKPTK